MAAFQVTPRAERGEKPKHLRKQGYVPIALVGRDHSTQLVKASLPDLQAAVKGADSHGVIEMQIEGGSVMKTMLKSVDGERAEDADGVNTLLDAVTTSLDIRAKVSDLPDHIEVDVSKLGLGEHISASDVALPNGVELMSSPDVVLFTVSRVPEPVLEEESLETTAEGEVQAEGDAGTATSA